MISAHTTRIPPAAALLVLLLGCWNANPAAVQEPDFTRAPGRGG